MCGLGESYKNWIVSIVVSSSVDTVVIVFTRCMATSCLERESISKTINHPLSRRKKLLVNYDAVQLMLPYRCLE